MTVADVLPHEIAATRTAGMSDRDRSDFLTAYYEAARGRDLDGMWLRAALDPTTTSATLAGLVEGMAASRGRRG